MEASLLKTGSRNSSGHKRQPRSEGPKLCSCSFCQERPAAVLVEMPSISVSLGKQKRQKRQKPDEEPSYFCLLHYYTTSAVRVDTDCVSVVDQTELDRQLPEMQTLFADVFVELQQELSHESARAFAENSHDPLAILHKLHKQTSNKKKPPPPPQSSSTQQQDKNAGGFLLDVPLPERLLRTQQQQARLQGELTARMKQAAHVDDVARGSRASTSTTSSITKRRKPSRKSIWNVVMEQEKDNTDKQETASATTAAFVSTDQQQHIVCTCGSSKVHVLGSNTNRNQDVKGETWGNKDRGDEVVTRYQCLECGKTWNEEA